MYVLRLYSYVYRGNINTIATLSNVRSMDYKFANSPVTNVVALATCPTQSMKQRTIMHGKGGGSWRGWAPHPVSTVLKLCTVQYCNVLK